MCSKHSSRPSPDRLTRRASQAGFTVVELLIATMLSLVVLGAAFFGFQGMIEATDGAGLIADLNLNLRSAMNVITRDLVSAGHDMQNGVPIPSGDDVMPLVRLGPADEDLGFDAADTNLPAVNTGDGLGPEINGVNTDVVTILMVDPSLSFDSADLTVAADGSDATVDEGVSLGDLAEGDLLMFARAGNHAMQMVTGIEGQTIQFAEGDDMNLNQRAAAAGTILLLGDLTLGDVSAERVLMISYYIDAVTDPGRPRLIRRVNLGPERTLAVGIDNLQLTYDLVDGDTNPVNQPEPVDPNTPDQIRKATVFLSGQSFREWRRNGQVLRSSLSTQVGLRSLAFRDRY
jgi:type IV pilus assembly protein PilW